MTGIPTRLAYLALLLPPVASPQEPVLVHVAVESRDVVLGEPFVVTVTRAFRSDLAPEPWDAAVLAPLVVRAVSAPERTRDAGGRTVETRRCVCQAFALDTVEVPAFTFRAAAPGGGPAFTATAEPLRLTVATQLDRERQGPAEPPADVLVESTGYGWAALTLLAVLLTVGWFRRARYGRRAADTGEPADPDADALRRLEDLASLEPKAFGLALAAALRSWLFARGASRVDRRTTEETLLELGSGDRLGPEALAQLTAVLTACDLVKFAAHRPDSAERTQLVECARRVVTARCSVAEDGSA